MGARDARMEEALLVGGALVLGFGAGVAGILLARRVKAPKPEPVVDLEVVMDGDESPATFVPPAPKPPAAAPAPAPASAPPPAHPRAHPERAPAMVLTRGVEMADAAYQRPAPPRQAPEPRERPQPWARPPPRQEPPPTVPSEWARRLVGPLEPGRAKGVCSGCGTSLSVSMQRPLKIACPVCGRTRLLA